MSQADIAGQMGKPQSFVSKYERGERRLDFTEFIELAKILSIDIPKFINEYHAAIAQRNF